MAGVVTAGPLCRINSDAGVLLTSVMTSILVGGTMAKRAAGAGEESIKSTEERVEEFAEDLGRLLGTARAKAEGWMGQRQAIVKHLEGVRDTASQLLNQLRGSAESAIGIGDGRR